MRIRAAAGIALLAFAAPTAAQPVDPAPWLQDLEQMRQAFQIKYANREWQEQERGLKLDPLFDQVAGIIRKAPDESAMRSLFDRLQRKLADGHVEIEWKKASTAATPSTPASTPSPAPDLCAGLGYSARQNRPGSAQALPGYVPLDGATNPFPSGTITSAGRKVGVVRIGIFQPQGYPAVCQAAIRELKIAADKPCDSACEDQVLTWAYRRLTVALEERARQLKAAGAQVLLIDITDNGGGSEWSEAAARIFSPRLLVSERRGFVRGEHWAKQWRDLAAQLREYAKSAPKDDRRRLLAWAKEADSALNEALKPCVPPNSCVATAGYATGFVGSARSGEFAGKDWGVWVFNPAQFPYHDGVWEGPLIVLVDQETWSAAEEFAALLQDNRAATVMGARTGGAGCGYTYGGDPTTLKNSGVVLKLPDCVRFRSDGSNEVRGIIPDVPIALRADDGLQLKAKLVADRLPDAIAQSMLSRP
jgi:hypothetical protein